MPTGPQDVLPGIVNLFRVTEKSCYSPLCTILIHLPATDQTYILSDVSTSCVPVNCNTAKCVVYMNVQCLPNLKPKRKFHLQFYIYSIWHTSLTRVTNKSALSLQQWIDQYWFARIQTKCKINPKLLEKEQQSFFY